MSKTITDEEARKNLKIIFKAIGSKDCDAMCEVADRLEGKELVIFTQRCCVHYLDRWGIGKVGRLYREMKEKKRGRRNVKKKLV